MTHPEETAPASLAEAAASNCMPVGTIAWDNVKRETEKAIRLALSASQLQPSPALAKSDDAVSTPTEWPASQTEGVGVAFSEWELGVLRQSASAKHLVYLGHHATGGLKDNEIETMERWKALCDKLAALTPPETVEAVPDDLTAAYMAGVERGREEAAHLREESGRRIAVLERLYGDASQHAHDQERLVSSLERERDEAVKALETARAATASDPVTATDDRERLVEALRPFANAVFNDNGDMTVSPVTDYDACVNAYFSRQAALDKEASR